MFCGYHEITFEFIPCSLILFMSIQLNFKKVSFGVRQEKKMPKIYKYYKSAKKKNIN